MVSALLRVLLVLGLIWIGGSFLGDVHPLGDSLAVFRIYVAAVLLPLALLCWRWWLGKAALAVLAGILVLRGVLAFDWSPVAAPTFTLYQKNLLYYQFDRGPFLADVTEAVPDFITLQEVSDGNRQIMAALSESYPHQKLCPGRGVGGVAILSRYPLAAAPCPGVVGLTQAVADTPRGPVRIIAIHASWPYPYRQAEHVARLITGLGELGPEPVILAGDFNMVPWGRSVARLRAATGATARGHIEPTWSGFGIRLMIDHVFAGPDADVDIDIRPAFGSDHNGILARIAF